MSCVYHYGPPHVLQSTATLHCRASGRASELFTPPTKLNESNSNVNVDERESAKVLRLSVWTFGARSHVCMAAIKIYNVNIVIEFTLIFFPFVPLINCLRPAHASFFSH